MYPLIHNIVPFDATIGTTLSFTWNGNQFFRLRCIIKENKSGDPVYDKTIDAIFDETIQSTKSLFPIPPDSGLVNGTYYVCYKTVFDEEGQESAIQNSGKPFYCFSTPVFNLSIKKDQVIRSSSFETTVTYSQAEGEKLDHYRITLYSYQQTAIQSSGNIYLGEEEKEEEKVAPFILTSLENANQYYIRAIGETEHGMPVDTGNILFTVAYTQAQVFSTLEVNNIPDIGAIEIRSNIISATGESDHDVIYIDGEKADLRDNRVTFDIGFEVEGDFSKIIRLSHPRLNQPFLILSDSIKNTTITCLYREGLFDNSSGKKAVIELRASSAANLYYVLYSNYFDIPGDSDSICCLISRTGNFYDTKVVSG